MSRARLAAHEAGHAVCAVLTGQPVQVVSIRRGRSFEGVCIAAQGTRATSPLDVDAAPYQQAADLRAAVEASVVCILAGDIAARLVPLDDYEDPSPDRPTAAQMLDALPPRHLELLTDAEAQPTHPTDRALAHDLAWAFTGDTRLSGSYLAWLTVVAEQLIHDNVPAIARVARALLDHQVLTGEAVAALVNGDPRVAHPSARGSMSVERHMPGTVAIAAAATIPQEVPMSRYAPGPKATPSPLASVTSAEPPYSGTGGVRILTAPLISDPHARIATRDLSLPFVVWPSGGFLHGWTHIRAGELRDARSPVVTRSPADAWRVPTDAEREAAA